MKEYQPFTLKDPALGEWKDIPDTEIFNDDGRLIGISPRKCQLDILKDLKFEQNTIIDAPGGSGKSMASIFLHVLTLEKFSDKKLIIAIPKRIIKKGFKAVNLHYPDGTKISWDPIKNLCEKNGVEKKKKAIAKFLKKSNFPKGINERILITTHQALSRYFTELEKNKLLDKKLFHNTSVVIDEAHRVLSAEDEETGIKQDNHMGRLVMYLFQCQEKNTTIGIHLMTATLFRGDNYTILPNKYFEKFKRYYLPIDKHWAENIQHIEDYSYNYVVYKDDFLKETEKLTKRHRNDNILYLVPRGEGKYEIAEKIKKLRNKYPPTIGPGKKYCDLVDDRSLIEREKLVDDLNENEDAYDTVLSVDIFNEGADYPPCEVIIDLEPSVGSLPKAVQRWLRAFRDKDYKKHLHYYSFLPFVLNTLDEEKYLQILNKNFTAFMLVLTIQDAVNPILIPRPKKKREGETTKIEKIDYFTNEVSDPIKRSKIKKDIYLELITLKAQSKEDKKDIAGKDIECSIKKILKKNKIKKHIDEIAQQIYVSMQRNIPKNRDMGTDELVDKMVKEGFAKVTKQEINEMFKDMIIFPALITGVKTFVEIREIYGRIIHKTEEEHIEFIKKNNIRDSTQWYGHNNKNNLKEKGYYSFPWEAFSNSCKEFFERIWGKIKTKEEHICLIKENNITGNKKWNKYYEKNNLREQKYLKCPWQAYNESIKEFFSNINNKIIEEEDYLFIIKKNNIRGSGEWKTYYKNNLKKQKYYSALGLSLIKLVKNFLSKYSLIQPR